LYLISVTTVKVKGKGRQHFPCTWLSTWLWRHARSEDKAMGILNLKTGYKCIISITLWPLYPWRNTSSSHRIRGWVDSRVALNALKIRKISWPGWESESDSSVVEPVHWSLHAWANSLAAHCTPEIIGLLTRVSEFYKLWSFSLGQP